MDLGYTELLIGLLAVYMAYSVWAGLDPRYPIVGAIATLLAAFVVQAAGDTALANDLALDTFLFFLAGLALIVIDRIRPAARRRAEPTATGRPVEPPADPAGPR